MRKKSFLCLLAAVFFSFAAVAQQLPNANFEQQGGSFNGSPQAASWNGSNVEQVGMKFTFTFWEEGGRNNSHCVRINNTRVGAMGIYENAPGYLSLGQPWSYVSGLDVSSATAGCDGSIPFAYRPDTLSVWVKSRCDNENMNIVFYSWKGTAQGASYKNKGGGCTSVSHTDEESDIRQTTDKNECKTDVYASQVAEGWLKGVYNYGNWTEVKVPIKYYNNAIPDKCNVIFSAGNYPNFRSANVNSTNQLYVDDVTLIYSSKVHEIRLGNLTMPGFQPNQTEYVYELESETASIPQISCYRSGRQLSGNELKIEYGAVGEYTTITVKAEDNSSTTVYRIKFTKPLKKNAYPEAILLDGGALKEFSAYQANYMVSLPYGQSQSPEVTVQLAEGQGQSYTLSPASSVSVPGELTITVYAEDTRISQTYTLHFFNKEFSDTTLSNILVNGVGIPGFTPLKTAYQVNVPEGTTGVPELTYETLYPDLQTIKVEAHDVESVSYIRVSAPGAATERVYKITYKIAKSENALLKSIQVDGRELPEFKPDSFSYRYDLPLGTTQLPVVSYTLGDAYQTVEPTPGEINGAPYKLLVRAQDGVHVQTYRISFTSKQSSNSFLQDILVAGVSLPDFEPTKTAYTYKLPVGTTELPSIDWVKGDEYQTVTPVYGTVSSTTKLMVYAQDGSLRVYSIAFSVEQATVSTLKAIYLDGKLLDGFQPERMDYSIELPRGTQQLPAITYDKHDDYQKVNKVENGVNGITRIIVTAQSGDITTYNLSFSVRKSSNANLADIQVGGVSLPGFQAEKLDYQYTLPSGTVSLPEITYTKGDAAQKVLLTKGGVNGTTTLQVTAEDGATQMYSIQFSVEKSVNAQLKMIYVNGVAIVGFQPEQMSYEYELPVGTTVCPSVSVDKYDGQTVSIILPSLEGTARIEVQPEEGSKNVYTIHFQLHRSSNATLADLRVDGKTISGFVPEGYQYTYTLPQGTTQQPQVTYTKAEDTQVVELDAQGVNAVTTLTVRAENGSTASYQIQFPVAQSGEAQLSDLQVGGSTITGFNPDTYTYTYYLSSSQARCPQVLPVKANAGQRLQVDLPYGQGDAQVVVYSEDGLHQSTYTIHFAYKPNEASLLSDLRVNGTTVVGFRPEQWEYTVTLPSDTAAVVVTYSKQHETESVALSQQATGASLLVTAENGTQHTYVLHYTYTPSNQSDLSDLQLYDAAADTYTSLSGFAPTTYSYSLMLPRGTADVPALNPVFGEAGQTVTIRYAGVNGTTEVEVVAADGQAKSVYALHFATEKSDNASLQAIQVNGEELTDFEPDKLAYDVLIPFPAGQTPAIGFERGDYAQKVQVTSAVWNQPSTLRVRAEDGTEKVYALKFKEDTRSLPTGLKQISLDGKALAGFQSDVYTYTVQLPYAATALPTLAYEKQYEQQTVVVAQQGMQATRIEVQSNVLGVEDKTYLIRYQPTTVHEAVFTDIQVNGVSLAGFASDKGSYVLQVTDKPILTYTKASERVNVEETVNNSHHIQWVATVPDYAYSMTYDVYFHYTEDVLPENGDFSHFVNGGKTGTKPTGWHYLGDFYASDGLVGSQFEPKGLLAKSDEGALLKTLKNYWTLGGWMPGMLTLGTIRASFGVAGSTVTSVSEGMPFRNTPDVAELRYKADYSEISGNKVRFKFDFAGEGSQPTLYEDGFDNQWKVQQVTLQPGDAPSSLNITVNSCYTENAADMGYFSDIFMGGYKTASSMNVDYVHLGYNSAIQGITVQGVAATMSGTQAFAHIDAETLGLPSIVVQGAVPDQQHDVNWGEEVAGVREMSIRNYAEDGSYTDYSLTVVRPLSTNNQLSQLLVGDVPLEGFRPEQREYTYTMDVGMRFLPDVQAVAASKHATVSTAWKERTLHITVTSESGEATQYQLSFVPTLSKDATLQQLSVAGYEIGFQPETTEYAVSLPPYTETMPQINFTARYGQTVVLSEGGVNGESTVDITAEDGKAHQTYTVRMQVLPDATTTARLSRMQVVDKPEAIAFQDDIYAYSYARPRGEAVPVGYVAAYAQDTMEVTINAQTWQWHLFNRVSMAEHTYVLQFTDLLSDNADLEALLVNDTLVQGFDPAIIQYEREVIDPAGMQVEARPAMAGQSLQSSYDVATGVYSFLVTAEDGETTKQYQLQLRQSLSPSADLAAILVNQVALPGFDPVETHYEPELPLGTTCLPDIWAVSGAPGQTLSMRLGTLESLSYVDVLSQDAQHRKSYELQFKVKKSNNANLKLLSANQVPLSGFDSLVTEYNLSLATGEEIPYISYQKAEPMQSVEMTQETNEVRVTVTAADGVSKKTYTIHLLRKPATETRLADILLNQVSLPNFDPDTYAYEVELPIGTRVLPEMTTIAMEDGQRVQIQTNGIDGEAKLTVTSGDGSAQAVYTIQFECQRSENTYLKDILLDGKSLEGFDPDTTEYTVYLPVGTVTLPDVRYVEGDPYQTITMQTVGTVTTIHVVADKATLSRDYVLRFEVLKSTNANLAMIYVEMEPLSASSTAYTCDADFAPTRYRYQVEFPVGKKLSPSLFYYQLAEPVQTVDTIWVNGELQLRVQAEDGVHRQTYRVQVSVKLSDNTALRDLLSDGVSLPDFDPDKTSYQVSLPAGISRIPELSGIPGDDYQTLTHESEQGGKLQRVRVKAQNGDERVYQVQYLSSNAYLKAITVGDDKKLIPSFDPYENSYTVQLPYGTTQLPAIGYEKAEEAQTVDYTEATLESKEATLKVTAEDGVHTTTYVVRFVWMPSSNVDVKMLYYNGIPVSGFTKEQNDYEVALPFGTTQEPVVTVDLAEPETQTVHIDTEATPSGWECGVLVDAQDGISHSYYSIRFTIAKSSENRLASFKVFGKSVPHFNPNTEEYEMRYPDYTDSLKVIPTVKDVSYTLMDAERSIANVTISESDPGMLLVHVVAQNGQVRTYVLRTIIEKSNNTNLLSLAVDGVEVLDFNPDVREYYYKLPFGASTVDENRVTYVLAESGQTAIRRLEGMDVRIQVDAHDGVSHGFYTIHFLPDEFDPSTFPSAEDVCVSSTMGGYWRFTTRCNNVHLTLVDLRGRKIYYGKLPLVDPNIEEICDYAAEGYVYHGETAQVVAYFFTYNDKVIVGGKIRCQ